MGASAAAAIIIRKEKDLVAHFRGARALTATTAMSANALGVEQRLAWKRLIVHAVIREAAPGTYYLDEPSWTALQRTRRQQVTVILVLALILIVSIVLSRR